MMVVATKALTKKEQLRIVFETILKELYLDYDDSDIDEVVNELLKEVSIRTDLR